MEEISIDDEYDDGSDEGVYGFDFVNNSSSLQPNPQEISPNLPYQNIGDSLNSKGQLTIKSTSTIKNSVSIAKSSVHLNRSGEKLHRRGPGRPRKDILVQAPATASRRGSGTGNRIVKQHNSSHGFLRTTKTTSVRRNHIAGASKPIRTNTTTSTASLTSTQENNSFMSNVMLSSPLNDDGSNSLTSTPSITMETDQSPDLKFNRSTYDLPKDTQQRRDSPAVTSSATANLNFVSSSERVMQPPEELPFFPEKWPGKLCALCCLGERSQLGQGEMLRIKVSENEPKSTAPLATMLDSSPPLKEEEKNQRSALNAQTQLSNRRQKGLNKCKNPVLTTEYVDELEMIGHPKIVEFSSLIDGGYIFIHRTCAIWSMGITKDLATGILGNVDEVVSQSLKRKCSFCNRYGAHMACKMSCPKHFHLPCVAASGGFQIIQNFTAFCKEHLGQVPLVCTEDINCRKCYGLGDVSNLMICSICGDHYHGICIGVAQLPGVRAGWQCTSCRRCQICRVPDAKQADGRSLSCEQCHKMYHANCLRPVMTSIPKYGWKCRCCRICLDCGSRTPGAGTSSRWHSHYTVCDSCYQQRNKGFSCPCCSKAYRAAAYREMVKCSQCNKFVHSTCDAEADLAAYHAKKESNPDYEYSCPPCIKSGVQNGRMLTMRRTNSIDDENLALSQESLSNDNDQLDPISTSSSVAMDPTEKSNDFGLGKGKPLSANKMIAKKRLPGVVGRPKGGGKFSFQRKQRVSEFGRKRGPKAKMRGVFGVPGLGLQRPTSDSNNKTDEEPGVENRLVLCSAKDKYVLTQDICVMCGAIGTDQEGCLISCLQCGQCYHPYCVTVKVTKVILQRGWRCLDCTVCEGCGEKYDESRLILCDDCDISYHIYCIDPPLDIVPHGTWKCKWCAICQKCGSNTPGPNSTWQNSFTECGPCASQSQCAFCSEAYTDGELLIQCTHCERWSHGNCDEIHNEDDAERCIDEGYKCLLCRPKDVLPPHLIPAKKSTQNHINAKAITQSSIKSMNDDIQETSASYQIDGNHVLDGVCLSETGLSQIKSLQMELVRKKRKNKVSTVEPPPVKNQEAGIMAAIESVVAGGSLDNSFEKLEPLDSREEQEIYKDGMIWEKPDSVPPEGFALFTNEQGIVLLRKKRQRNLQKLGIGGFVVRNRTVRKEGANNDCDDTMDGSLPHFTVEESQPADKKKKQNRKKTKTKLLDTYPSYLQEAFFGKIILDKTKTKFEPSSSEDETQNSVTDDKTIQLSAEEINVLKAHRLKQQKLLEEKNKHQIPSTPAIGQSIPNKSPGNNAINPTMNQTKPVLSNVTPNSFRFATIKTDPSSQDVEMVDGNSLPSNIQCDTAVRKNVLNDIKMEVFDEIDQQQVNRIDHNWKPVTNNRMGMEWKTTTSPINNICAPDAVQKQQQTTQSLPQQRPPGPIVSIKTQIPTTNKTNPKQYIDPNAFLNTTNKLQQVQSSPQIQQQHQVQQSPAAIQMQLNQRALANQPQTNQTMHSLSQIEPIQQTVVDNKIITQKIIGGPIINDTNLQRIPITQTQVMQMNQMQHPVQQTDANKLELQIQPSKSAILDMDRTTPNTAIDDSLGNIGSSSASTGNNPKNSERMRQDEVLDGAATISAVLYANTAHPELKVDYPNWDERVKQILKKWRALSNEKRAPFLQKARENRSCLRKNSQDPEKAGMDIHQKNVRLQEHERQWKQLQAMRAREQQMQQMQAVESPSNQMQMPGNNNNNNNNPASNACPTNIGNQFQAQHQKTHRMVVGMPAGQQQFQLPQQRAVSVQLPPRQAQIQQRIVQGQFTQIQDISNKNFPLQSVELQTPPSPHNQYPLSPATSNHDQFSRPSSECSQDPYMNSPQTPRSFDHQSPTTSAGHSPANHMHMRTPMHKSNEMQNSIQTANSPSPYSSPGTPSQENNRQLRDLLQQQPQQNTSTFRQPLPPGMIARPPRSIGAQHQIRASMQSSQQFSMNPVQQQIMSSDQQQQTVKPVISVQNNSTINPSSDSMSTNMTQQQVPTNIQSNMNNPVQQCAPNAQNTEQQPMNTDNFINMEPKMNHSELEKMDDLEKMDKLEDDDLLGALGGEDDDDLFSFAEEMGSDFNILEYADPELDAEGEANLLDSLDFDDTDEKEKAKKAALAKANEIKAVTANQIRMTMSQNNEQPGSSGSIQSTVQQRMQQPQMQMQMSAQQRMQLQRNNPPPYPNPPPPYPDKEQPLLLEDLLEQEKREKEERERQASVNDMTNPNSSSLLSDQDFERLRADVLATQQGIPAQGLLPIQQQQMIQQQSQASQQQFVSQNSALLSQQAQGIRQQFIHRNINQQPQHQTAQQHMVSQQQVFQQPIKPNAKQLPNKQSMGNVFQGTNQIMNAQEQDIGMESTVVKKEGIPIFVGNLQTAPPLPPDAIVTEQDRQMQINYEQWLYSQENILKNQRDYYDAEVTKLRKSKKSLTTKQRILKKSGSDLPQNEALELSKVLREQALIQKHLEQSRKQFRQHTSTLQDYKNKQQAAAMKANAVRQQMAVNQPGQIVSPHNPAGGQTPHPSLMASSPSPAQANIMQMSVQSPLGNPSMHSPSPLMAQSPISNNILQSPGNPNMSPYNSMPSPRINSVEMQPDDSPFSPGPMSASPSPSLPGRLTSPAPRMTSPQHHRLTGQPMHSPSHVVYQQQTIKRPPQEFHQQQQQMIQMQRQQQIMQIQRQQQMMHQQQQNQMQQMQMQQNQMQQGGFMMNKQVQPPQMQQQQNQMQPMVNQQQAQQQQHQLPPAGYIYNKPGLRGGAPVHSMNRGAKRLPTQAGTSSGNTVNTIKKTAGSIKVTGTIKASGSRIIHRGKVANIITQDDFDETSNTSTISSPGNLTAQTQSINRNIKRTVSDSCYTTEMLEDIVVIHDSPDEKQRIMDYDDDNDKSVIGPEVSLSSVAQNVVDDDVLYDSSCKSTGSDFNIVSSPLESEVVEEYPLFPCVADYVDDGERNTIENDDDDNKSITIDSSDEDGKNPAPESPVYLDDMNLDTNSEEHFATTEEEIMSMNSEIIIMENVKSPDEQLHTTSEDFEAMIDSGNSKDGKDSNSSIELMEIESEQDISTIKQLPKKVTISKESPALHERTVITLCYPSTTSTAQIKGRPIQTAIVSKGAVFPTAATSGSAHLVKDATSAKYLLGNTTISVPVVKNIFSYRKPTGVIADKTGQIRAVTNKSNTCETSNKKIIGQPMISTSLANITGKKSNTTNYVTLSPLSIQHTSGGRIMQAKIVRTQPSQQIVTSANQLKIDPQFKKSLQPTLTYAKISSFSPLKMSQDVSLPTKLFEDESISPDSSIEQDESDLMLTEETIYTTEDTSQTINNTSNIDANKPQSGNIQKSTSPTISSLSNTDRIIEVDEMLNDDWKRKSPSKTENQVVIEKTQEETEKKKPVVPVHLIIKQRDTSQSSASTMVNHRLSSNLPQLSPLSQPNEITSNIGNASQQLRTIMSSINQNQNSINTSTAQTTANQNKTAITAVEIKSIPNTNVVVTSTITPTVKIEAQAGTAIPTTFENVLNRSSDVNMKTEVLDVQKNVSENPSTQITTNKVLNTTQGTFVQANSVPSLTTTSTGSIVLVKQIRSVSSLTNRSRSPVTVNSTGNKTQTFSVVKSSIGGAPIIISGQSAQQGSSVIIAHNKIPILTKIQTDAGPKLQTTIVPTVNSIAVASTTVTTSTINATEIGKSTQPTSSILSNTLSQPQHSRIIPYGDGHFTLKKPHALIVTTRAGFITNKVPAVVSSASVTSASSTAAIQNILQTSLYSQPSGSILSATLSQPSQKTNNTLLQTQLTGNNPFRRSKSTDEVPGFLKETPAQIISKRHTVSAMESLNIVKDEKDDTIVNNSANQKPMENNATENCKFNTVTIVPHKSDDSQNVLLKQLLQNSGSNTTPPTTPSTIPTIVSRSVTSLRAPSLGVVSSLEAQLARPVILPVPATPNTIQLKSNAISTATTPTSNSQPFNVQLNASSKNISGAVVTTSVDAPKTTVRNNQIVSRETSFVSNPASTEEKEELTGTLAPLVQTNQVCTTVTASTLMPIPSTTVTNVTVAQSTITITTKPSQPVQNQVPIVPDVMSTANEVTSSITTTTSMIAMPPKSRTPFQASSQIVEPKVELSNITPMSTDTIKIEPIIVQTSEANIQNKVTFSKINNESGNLTTILQTVIKQEESTTSQPSPTPISRPPSILSNADVKREFLDDNSQMSATSDNSSIKQESIKEELISNETIMDPEMAAKIASEKALELKRKKRREYQKQRRQLQTQNKDNANNTATVQPAVKKKSRKVNAVSKFDEDYDTFIDNLMSQLKLMPPMQILEPTLNRNYLICTAYGAGDLGKFGSDRERVLISGDLKNGYGRAELENTSDHYNTKPFGYKSPFSEQRNSSTHYGFYDQEFSPIKFNTDDDNRCKYDFLKERDIETPDTIISSSSPECVIQDSPSNFPGLRLIHEDEDEIANDARTNKRMSPQIPIVAPVPIRLKKGMSLTTDKNTNTLIDKTNIKDSFATKSRFGPPLPSNKDINNVTITLTLSSSAADDIQMVLQDLANILHIPTPKSYQIVERTTTPPSQKLGLYRTRGIDGKEGAPIDIQTILNGNAKFCRHCDVVILNTVIRAKAYEFPLLTQNTSNELMTESDDLYFCSKSCYKQFKCVPTNILEDKIPETSNTDCSTYDDTIKYGKHPNVLLTTATSITEKSEAQEDKSGKENIPTNDDVNNVNKTEADNDASNTNIMETKNIHKLPEDDEDRMPPTKKLKSMQYLKFAPGCFKSSNKFKKMTEKETTDMLFRMNITVTPSPKTPEDTRKCIFCHQIGDGVADGPSRLLNFDVDKWVHLNCALWSDGVYETVNGALMNLENALQQSFVQQCTLCQQYGATIKCFKNRCANIYHLNCAIKDKCVFYKTKTMLCMVHAPKTEKDNELTTLSVQRRVYVERDEGRQVASVMHHSELSNLLRVGSLIFLNVGQLLPHQLHNFHTPYFIYPIGYKIMRFYWSMRRPNKRCRYICSIADVSGRPEFRVLVQEPNEEDIELRDSTPKAIWQRILEKLAQLRKNNNLVQIFPKYIIGEDLFGLTEPAVVRILESLPGIETLTDYRFKYGRNPLLELPLAINPSGAARTEPKAQQNLSWKKPHTQRSGSASQRPTKFVASTSVAGEVACPYSKQFVHSKSSQYKKMKQEWRNNVFLARSKIQGLGLYAARDLEKHTMVIEYIGEVIRSELSELREKQYEAKNRGIYMFRLDEDRVVDATLSGGLARYINHSCNPNCVTEIVEVDREFRIIIFAKRRINRGEELSYDYKFDIEDDSHKISCMCGAPNCRKWMN